MKAVLDRKEYYLETEVYDKIKKYLQELNFNYSYLGTKLLIECIFLAYKIDLLDDLNLERYIYPIITKKYNKSVVNVKCSINYSTTSMYLDADENTITKFFGYELLDNPKPKNIIIGVLKKLNEGG